MLNKTYRIEYENEQEEACLTTAETLEEAMEVRIQLLEDGFKNVKIESVRV